MYKFFVT